MAAATSAQVNGSGHNPPLSPTFVQRVAAIPVVADTLGAVHSTIHANVYSAAVYDKAEIAALYLYEQSKPLQEKLAGPIGQVDAVANKGLDFVQAKAPFVFEIRTEDLISKARQPADQALAYGKTYTDAASTALTEQLTRSSQRLSQLQDKLHQAVQSLPKDPKSVQEQLGGLSEQVVGEIERLYKFVGEKRKELPQQAQQAVTPLAEKLREAYFDVYARLTEADTPILSRATNVLKYSREQAHPIVSEAIESMKKVVQGLKLNDDTSRSIDVQSTPS